MIYKRKRPGGRKSPIWSYDFEYGGKRYRGSTGLRDKGLAQKYEDQLKAEARLGQPLSGPQGKALPTFREYAQGYLEGDGALKRSARTDRSVLNRSLFPAFGDLRLDVIRREDVVRFRNRRLAGDLNRSRKTERDKKTGVYRTIGSIRKKPAPRTVQVELAILHRILELAVRDGLLAQNPAHGVRVPKFDNRRSRVIDREEYSRLLLAINPRKAPHLRPILVLAYETGMRMGEILSLRWSDVDLDGGWLHLPRTKNGDARDVPLSEAAEGALRDWRRRDSTHLFPGRDGTGHLEGCSAAFARLFDRAKVEGARFHDLRHTFTSRMLEAGVDMRRIMEITGHRDASMYHRYSHPSKQAILSAVRKTPAESPHYSPQAGIGVESAAVNC